MALLVCAATSGELAAFWPEQQAPEALSDQKRGLEGSVHWLITGAGIPAALECLFLALPEIRPHLILQIGIAGAYAGSGLAIGEVVLADADTYGDIGFQLPEPPLFRSIRESAFSEEIYNWPLPLTLPSDWHLPSAKQGRGCTVNQCTGTEETGALREKLFGAIFETMEGAAAAQAAKSFGIPVCQIRAISNRAGTRDMRPENIRTALAALRNYLLACPGRRELL